MIRARATLNDQLSAFHDGMMDRLPACERLAKERDAAANAAMMRDAIPQPGDLAPSFALPDQHGRIVDLSASLAMGPVVVLFIRGFWCPFCTLTLRAYQDSLDAIHALGAELLAIAPQPVGSISQSAERDLLAFPTLSDAGNAVARQFGVQTEISAALRPMHLRLGHDLPRLNGTGDWTVPLPATFVIGTDGRIAFTHVETDNYRRLEPEVAVDILRALTVGR